ncbi:MAG TPA: glycosyltransferase [Pyrinomonadaceae bacterium]
MKILYCIPTMGNGGAERQLSYLAAELQRMGHEVHVASSRGGPNLERLRSVGVRWHSVGGVSNRDPLIFLRLVALMRRLKPDVVQTILAPMDIIAGAATLVTRTPWIIKESSSAPLYLDGLRSKFRSTLGRRADGIISNSIGGDDYWRSVGGANPLGVIRNAIPFAEIEAANGFNQVYARTNGEKVVLFAGRLDTGKNVQNLIRALAQVADEVPFVALVCGDGPRRQHLERLAGDLGIADRVVFTGYVSNIWTLMKDADAFVSLSRFEGCPNVVIEAMACGCPLIVSDIPAHREILNGHAAAFVDPDKPAEAGTAIKMLLTEGTPAHMRAKAALENGTNWRIEHVAQKYQRVYQDVATRAAAPAANRSWFTQSAWLALLSAGNAALAVLMSWYVVVRVGVGAETDAFFASAVVPQCAFVLLTTTLLPVLVPLLATRNDSEFSQDVWSFFSLTAAVFVLLAVVLYWSASVWVPWFVPGFAAPAKTLTANLTRLQLVSMVLNALIVTLWAAHHARHRFVWVELSAVVANVAGLSFLVLTLSRLGIWAAALNTIFYNSLKLAFLLPILGSWRLPAWRSPTVREALQRLKPLLPGQVYLRTDPALDRFLTSMTGSGTLSLLHMAQQIYANVVLLLGKAVVAPMAPKLAVYAREERWSTYRRLYQDRFVLLAVFTVLGCLLVIAGAPVLRFFGAEAGIGPGNLHTLWLTMIALGGMLVGGALVQATAGAFYGMGNTKTPTKLSTLLYTLYIPIKVWAFFKFGLIGLAATMSAYALTNCVSQFWLLRKEVGRKAEPTELVHAED